MADTVTTIPNGIAIPIDSLEQSFTYTAASRVETATVEYQDNTFVQTFTYDESNTLLSISQWVQQ